MLKKQTRIIEYMIPALLCGLVFTVILAINGLWPFGKQTIDYYDMAQWADLFYYHNYDVLQGTESFIYDWYTSLGRVIPGLNEPSLFDILFYFVPRNMILECMSLLMLVKIMFAVFFMGIFIRSINEDMPYVYRMILSAGYGLCGFVLVNYTVPQWIDMAAIVPLVLMFAQKALKTGRFIGLAATVFLLMIDDYYFTIQTLIFVFLIGGLYIAYRHFSKNEEKTGEIPHVTALAAGVLFGLAASSFSWIPDIAFAFSSARFGNGSEGGLIETYMEILEKVQPSYLSRWFSLLGLAAPAAIVAMCMIRKVREKKIAPVIFSAGCIVLVTAQLFCESIHLILHFGSYVDYPVRNGFMIYCVMAGLAAGLYKGTCPEHRSVRNINPVGVVAGLLSVAVIITVFRRWYTGQSYITDHTVLIVTMGIMLACSVAHFILMSVGNGKYRTGCIYLWIAEALIFGTIMIGKPVYDSGYGNDPEQEGEFIRITDQLVSQFGDDFPVGEMAATNRVNNPDTSLNANYGSVMRRETLSGWSNLATPDQISGATSLGYSSQFTRTLDSGGTVFSDTLLHITDIISHEEQDDVLYKKIATVSVETDHMTGLRQDYSLYRNRFEFPFAISVIGIPERDETEEGVAGVINGYSAAMGYNGKLASEVRSAPEVSEQNGHKISEYTIDIKGSKTLYFTGKCVDTDYYNTRISVNGDKVRIPSINENDNELFPAHFNNNTVELGSFRDETVSVKIDMDQNDPNEEYDFYLFELDIEGLSALCKTTPGSQTTRGGSSIDVVTENLSEKYSGVLIPVSYDSGWSAEVNGTKEEVRNVNGLFMYVPVKAGVNKIHMSYFPRYMSCGICVSIASVGFLIIITLVKRKKTENCGKYDAFLICVYEIAAMAAVLFVYFIPIAYALYKSI